MDRAYSSRYLDQLGLEVLSVFRRFEILVAEQHDRVSICVGFLKFLRDIIRPQLPVICVRGELLARFHLDQRPILRKGHHDITSNITSVRSI